VETPLAHRDEPGGLFIGTSKHLFVLMNSAPAELLHLLTYAALQPSLARPFFIFAVKNDCNKILYAAKLQAQLKKNASDTCQRRNTVSIQQY
jgi:hypothetical protein